MTDRLFNTAVYAAFEAVKRNTPYKTGNLRYNATRITSRGERRFVIYVDTATAPYFKYVNGTRFGRNIRTTGYWKRAAYAAADSIAATLGGRVEI